MKLIVGNWKMNGSISELNELIHSIESINTNQTTIILCVPFTMLYSQKRNDLIVNIGAQDVSCFDSGAYTGDISATMLQEVGTKYVIIGHSERRILHQETNDQIKQKAMAAIQHNITPIICVGESLEDRKSGKTKEIITKMLLESIPSKSTFIVAYEPIWAIGKGITPSKQEISEIHNLIYDILLRQGLKDVKILYGASVNKDNAKNILSIQHVDGLLIGSASLKTETLLPIIEEAQ